MEIKTEFKKIVSAKNGKTYYMVSMFYTLNGNNIYLGKPYFLDEKDKVLLKPLIDRLG